MNAVAGAFAALVIDDDEFTRKTTLRALAKLGATSTYEASNGADALCTLSASTNVDVIICDLNMPEVDGIETLRHLAEINHEARIILASGADLRVLRSAKDLAAGFGLRSLRAISKPITVAKLREALAAPVSDETGFKPAVSIAVTAEEFKRGLAAHEFIAHYQPKVAVATRAIAGAEALVRWKHPVYGLLSPYAFLPLAQQTGQLEVLTDCVLSMAIARCAGWKREGLETSVSVNLPISSLISPDLPHRIEKVLLSHGLEARHLTLEVTEDGWLQQETAARETLMRLRMKGFGLSIDDFGTGYSTLQQLLHAPFNELKIDQSFVRKAIDDEESAIVLSSSISMAHQLKLKVVAEGVETKFHWDLLAKLGCDIIQGYYVSKPIPGDAMLTWATEWSHSER